MSTIRFGELVNQDLLDENGLRKKPYDHERLTKDERKVVVQFTDQSFLKVVLVNGEVVRLRELRENIYNWFPGLRPQRSGPTFRTVRQPSTTLPRNRVDPSDVEFRKQLRVLIDRFTDLDTNLIDTRRSGRIATKYVIDDFLQMETIADIAILLEKVTISEAKMIFSELYPKAETHRKSYLWLRTAFLSRYVGESYLLNSIHRALLPSARAEFDDETRRLQLTAFMGYRKYKSKTVELIDRPNRLPFMLNEIGDTTQQRILSEQVKDIRCYGDRILIRMQYMLIEKVLKPLQNK